MTGLTIPAFTFSPDVQAVPCEDIVDGMVINAKQITPRDVHPEEIYHLANIGMTMHGICGKFGMDYRTINFHFSKTLARGRADAAARLLTMLHARSEWTDPAERTLGGPDMKAVDILLRRVDPEPKEQPTIIVAPISTNPSPIMDLRSINDLELPT